MRTTLNIKDDVIKQVIALTGAKNKSQAVNQVLEAFVREKRMAYGEFKPKNILKK